ncbi:MAG TPA: signal peptidase I [Candidatus Nitrosotalea sp.]|nr:signal peptidase I [Candidatus Nitrosotalea sp.]
MTKLSLKSGIVKDIIIVVVGIAIIWIGLRVAFGTENPFYVVSSGSMIPNLEVFDVIVVQGHVDFDQLKVGDIIVFNRPDGHDKVIVHRVAEILNKDPLVIRTKGDANPGSIPGTDFPITKGDYIGKVVYVIPQIGYVTRILTPPINYIIIAVIVGIMLVKQFGKPKSSASDASNIQDKTDSDTSDADKTLSSDKSYLTDSDKDKTDLGKLQNKDSNEHENNSNKSDNKDSEIK